MKEKSDRQKYTLEWMYYITSENRQYLAMIKKPKRRLQQKEKNIGAEYNLINDLGFNLCIASQSLVMRLVTYFEVKGSHQNKGPKEVKQELEWTRIGLGPVDVNLQTKELYCNYSVLIDSPEQKKSSLLCYPTIVNFRRIIRRNKLHNCQIFRI